MKRVGILGLPQAGKTTLFEILMQGAGAAAPPGASARDRVGVVKVPDERIDHLTAMFNPKKTDADARSSSWTAPRRGRASRARAQDLFTGVRQCDALVAVVRDFENPAVPALKGVDAARDLRELEAELVLNDLAHRRDAPRADREGAASIGKKEAAAEGEVLRRLPRGARGREAAARGGLHARADAPAARASSS